jgi:hypothetical protein
MFPSSELSSRMSWIKWVRFEKLSGIGPLMCFIPLIAITSSDKSSKGDIEVDSIPSRLKEGIMMKKIVENLRKCDWQL